MKKQKIIKVGNSLAVTLPAEFVRDGNFAVGDEFLVEHNVQHKTLYMQSAKKKNKPGLTPEFFEWLDEFVKENDSMLRKLANTP